MLIIGIGAALTWLNFNGGKLLWSEVSKAAQEQGYSLKSQSSKLSLLPPRWTLRAVTLESFDPGVKAEAERLDVLTKWNMGSILSPSKPLLELTIHMEQPRATFFVPDTDQENDKTQKVKSSDSHDPSLSLPRDASLLLSVRNGEFATQGEGGTITASNFNGSIKIPSVNKLLHGVEGTEPHLEFELSTALTLMGLHLPLKSQAQVQFQPEWISLSEARVQSLGLDLKAQARMARKTPEALFELSMTAPDLSQLASVQENSPVKLSAGGVKVHVRGQRNLKEEWEGALKSEFQSVRGTPQIEHPDLKLEGEFIFHGQFQAAYKGQELAVPPFNLALSMDDLALSYKDLFSKPRGLVTRVVTSGSKQGDDLNISTASLQMGAVQIQSNATISSPTKNPEINLDLQIPSHSVDQWRQLLPPLKEKPLKGSIGLQLKAQGPLKNLEELKISSSANLQKIQGHVDWKGPDAKRIQGPFSVHGEAQVQSLYTELQTLGAHLDLDLSRLKIEWGEVFKKSDTSPLSLKFQISHGQKISTFQPSSLKLGTSEITWSGRVEGLESPLRLNLKVGAHPLDTGALTKYLPSLKELPFTSVLRGDLALEGVYREDQELLDLPIRITGDIRAQIPTFALDDKDDKESGSTAKGPSTPIRPEPFLEKRPIFEASDLKFHLSLGSFLMDDVEMKNISAQGRYNKGDVTGSAQVENSFGGSLQFSEFSWNVLKPSPPFKAQGQARGLDLKQLTQWIAPDWKDSVAGKFSGKFQGHMPFPPISSSPLHSSSASGELRIEDFHLNSGRIDEMIMEKLSQIPGLGEKIQLKTQNLNALVQSKFSLDQGNFSLDAFRLETPDPNELRLKGTLSKDMELNFKGVAHLKDAPIRGSVREANSDEQGRFVLPIALRGTLFRPTPLIADATVQTLLKNTARKEADKARARASQAAKKEVQKAQDQLKQNVEREAEKVLDRLFRSK